MTSTLQLDVSSPFHRSEAFAAGLSDADLRSARFQAIFRGVFISASIRVNTIHRGQAALKVVRSPDAHLSHASAGRLHGVPLPPLADEHVTVPHARERRRTTGVQSHVAPGDAVERLRGPWVSSCERTFVELAAQLELIDLVIVGDHLVRRGQTTLAGLRAHVAASTLPGAAVARAAVDHVRAAVDSPMETRLRMLLVLAGLPEPEINTKIRAGDGTVLRRYDLSWPEVKVIVEYDGRHHVEVVANWESDLKRREAIDDSQWRIVVVIASGIFAEPEETVRRVFRVLRARGLRGVPQRPSDAWRPYFPGHR